MLEFPTFRAVAIRMGPRSLPLVEQVVAVAAVVTVVMVAATRTGPNCLISAVSGRTGMVMGT